MSQIRKKSRRVSYMPSGWIEQAELGPRAGGTVCLTIGCPDDFFAVRVGFANLGYEPWRINKLFGRASASFNDLVVPVGQADWVPFAASGEDQAGNRLVHAQRPYEITVTARTLEAVTTDCPRWTWTDWAPIASIEPDPESALRILMLRALVPSGQVVSYAVGEMRRWIGNKTANKGFKCFTGGLKFDIDRVNSIVAEEPARAWIDNNPVNGSMLPVVQFLTFNRGITGMVVGDSHHQGTSTTDQLTNFLFRAVTEAMPRYIGVTPLGYVNVAQGGSTSLDFFGRLNSLIRDLQPSYVVLPGWTANDRDGDTQAGEVAISRFFGRLLLAVETCEAEGALPILLTPFPRDPGFMGPSQLGAWNWIRERILNLRERGVTVIDATLAVGDVENGLATGKYKLGLSNDSIHPDDAGHQKMADLFAPIYQELS